MFNQDHARALKPLSSLTPAQRALYDAVRTRVGEVAAAAVAAVMLDDATRLIGLNQEQIACVQEIAHQQKFRWPETFTQVVAA